MPVVGSRTWLGLGLMVLVAVASCVVAYLVVHQPDLPVVPIPHRSAG